MARLAVPAVTFCASVVAAIARRSPAVARATDILAQVLRALVSIRRLRAAAVVGAALALVATHAPAAPEIAGVPGTAVSRQVPADTREAAPATTPTGAAPSPSARTPPADGPLDDTPERVAPSGPVPQRWVQRHYGSVDGLPVSSASSAQVDGDGFLWLATHDGLARFDGEQFDVHDSMRFPAMSGNRVQSIHKDAHGRLFAHTAHGDWLHIASGAIERASLGADDAQGVRHVDAASLCLTTARGLHCPDGDGAFPLHVPFPQSVDPALAVAAVRDELAWLVGSSGDVWLHRDGEWRLVPVTTSRRPLASTVAIVDRRGDFWGGIHGGLVHVRADGTVGMLDEDRQIGFVLQLREDAAGTIWIGGTRGLFRIVDGALQRVAIPGASGDVDGYLSWEAPDAALWVRDGHRLWRFPSVSDVGDSRIEPALVSSGLVLNLLFGDDGTVWVMTLRDGIHRLTRPRVELLGRTASLERGNVYGVTRDRDGTMWLGTLGDGVLAIAADGTFRRYGTGEGLPGEHPWLVAAAPDGSVFAGTYAPGLWRMAPGTQTFAAVPLPDALFGAQVLAIAFDTHDRMWLGTSAGAWRNEDGRWRRRWPETARRVRVNALAFSDAGDVWFGGSDGVWRSHDGESHAVAEKLLSNTSVRDLFRASDGALWISTDGRGLVRVAGDDPAGRAAVRLGRAEGLPSNSPHAVREDARGHLWVNSNQGIFRIARGNLAEHLASGQRLSPLVLGLSDGLTELEGNGGVQPAAAFDRQGRLWFPSQRGIVRFDPLAMPLREQAPRAVIDAVESEGAPVAHTGGTLPVGMRSILVRYGAADLRAGGDLRFRYRLLPQDRGWTDALNERSATFASLDPGAYRFEVVAGNSDGVWADSPTVLTFTVPHRWHETAAFRLSLAAAAGLLLLVAVRWRIHRLRGRAAALDRQVAERTEELRLEKQHVEAALSHLSEAHAELARTHAQIEDSNLRLAGQAQRLEALDRFRTRLLADVSHELRTPVMLVSMPLRELHAQAGTLGPRQRERLGLSLKQLDRLGGLVEQLVGLVQAESGQMPLRLHRIDLVAALRDIVAGYQPMAVRAQASLVFEARQRSVPLFADREHLTTIFGNLIDNALKHAPAGSAVTVRLDGDGDGEHARVQVQDAGPGFDADVASRLFKRFYRAEGPPRQGREGLGIGLALARELVELHGGRIAARSEPGAGATFVVELPLGSAHVSLDDLALDAGPALADAREAATVPKVDGRGGRVLLVEDHPDLAAYLADRLGEHLPVAIAGSAEQALAVLEAHGDICLVISDVVLPGISGIELCRQLAGRGKRAPAVILISARTADVDRQAGLDAGAFAYLAKPFAFDALLVQIARAWPAAAPRLSPPPAAPGEVDALLAIALGRLGDPGFSIPDWAGLAHLSERQLRRRVNELTGQSPQTWLREQRLLRVRHLLRSGECRTLAEAGARCGLDNPAYLYRSYRARFGDG